MQRDSLTNTFRIAGLLCIICSVVVSASAVGLRSKQETNRELDKKRNVLLAAGKIEDGEQASEDRINELFASIDTQYVNLKTGDVIKSIDGVKMEEYNHLEAAENPSYSEPIPKDKDVASINRREKYAPVYLVLNEQDQVEQYVIPIRGYGLWSTLYGFLALKFDDNNELIIQGITFYKHGETPGLGGEVENPRWKRQWNGKKAYNEQGEPAINIVKPDTAGDNPYLVDGISGATITSDGVENLLHFWLGEDGFGPYLKKQREQKQGE